jgi:hypothetical protein
MRDIKFRAWDIDRNIMINGAVQLQSNIIFHRAMLETAKNVVWLQFTGFKDKNGTEIYEGDKLHLCGSNFNYKVVFENGSFVLYHLVSLNGALWGELSKFYELKMTAYQLEVTGNIYDV